MVQSILVTEGARVVGQPVLVLERNQTQSAVDEVEAELASLTAARARLVAEVGDGELSFRLLDKFPEFVKNQESLAKRRRVALEDEPSRAYRPPCLRLAMSSSSRVHWPRGA